MTTLGRRSFLASTAALGLTGVTTRATAAPALLHRRLTLPSGVQSGDVTTSSAVLWARSDGPGRLVAEISSGHRSWHRTGRIAGADVRLHGEARPDGPRTGSRLPGRPLVRGPGRTARRDRARTLLDRLHAPVGDQLRVDRRHLRTGLGHQPRPRRTVGYRAMHETRPDFFLHSGDTIYADGPIAERVVEPDGQVWRNLVTEEVSKVAETLTEFRGRHRTRRSTHNVRAMNAEVPGHRPVGRPRDAQQLVPRAGPRRRSVHRAARRRARRPRPQAWQENMPIADPRSAAPTTPGSRPPASTARSSSGAHLDVFCLDMRTYKDPNTAGLEPDEHPHPRPGAGRLADPRGQPVAGHLEGDRRRPAARASSSPTAR